MSESTALAALTHHEKLRIAQAAFYIRQLCPGPIGEVAARELMTWEEFGYRLGRDKLVMATVEWAHKEWAQREGRVA